MIVRRTADGWLLVRQADHAHLAGEMLRLATAPELLARPRRRELLRAAAEHDNGWWEEDAAPRLDLDSGGPLDFRRLPVAARRELWLRGIERYAEREPYVAALVAGHCLRVAPADSLGAGGEELHTAIAARRSELLASAGVPPDEAEHDDRWLRLADEMSLVAATLEPTLLTVPGWHVEVSELEDRIELRLEPFTWTGATTLVLEARRLAVRLFPDPVALGRELVAAPRTPLAVRIAPR